MKHNRAKQYYRFTVDRWNPKRKQYDHTVELTSDERRESGELLEVVHRPDHSSVDEVVIGDWLHIEAMDRKTYWMNVAGVTLWVGLGKDGSVKSVRVHAAGEYDLPRDGVEYEIDCGHDHSESEAP